MCMFFEKSPGWLQHLLWDFPACVAPILSLQNDNVFWVLLLNHIAGESAWRHQGKRDCLRLLVEGLSNSDWMAWARVYAALKLYRQKSTYFEHCFPSAFTWSAWSTGLCGIVKASPSSTRLKPWPCWSSRSSPSFLSVCGSLSSQNPICPKSKGWRPNSRVFRRLNRTNKFVFSSEFKPFNTPGFLAIQRLINLYSYLSAGHELLML